MNMRDLTHLMFKMRCKINDFVSQNSKFLLSKTNVPCWLGVKSISDMSEFDSKILNKEEPKLKIYVTRPDIPTPALETLKNRFDITVWSEPRPVPRDELLNQIKDKDGLFCLLTDKIDDELLDAAGPKLRVISTMSVGYDHINVDAVKKRGVKLGFTPNVLTEATAELTVALLLATSRRLFEAHTEIIRGGWGSWSPMWMCGTSLSGSTVGILGFGRIGQEVTRKLKPFKVANFLYSSRNSKPEAAELGAKKVDIDELLGKSDFVIITIALNSETKGMFNDRLFRKMKKTAILINTSRGDIVDQNALIRALEEGTIQAAGLDVMTPEPLPKDHKLLKLKNCVIIPHIGSATIQTRTAMAQLAADNIVAALLEKKMPAEL